MRRETRVRRIDFGVVYSENRILHHEFRGLRSMAAAESILEQEEGELQQQLTTLQKQLLEEFSNCFMRKLWWLEMVNFIEVLEDIGCFGFWDVGMCVHVNLERIWH